MFSVRDLLGCRCHANAFFSDAPKENPSAHTFAWAKAQYAEDRPVVPLSQSLDLKLSFDKKELRGFNSIRIRAVQKTVKTFTVDSIDLAISKVLVDDKDVDFVVQEKTIRVNLSRPLERNQEAQLKIFFSCQNPRAGLYFIQSDEKYRNRPLQAWTQGQDDDARYWFPSFDEPRLKAQFEMKIEVPKDFIATSNGRLIKESRTGETWNFHWKSDLWIPSYLVTLTVGQFEEIKDEALGIPTNYLFEKGRRSEAQLSFGKTPQMMELFSKVLGVKYPYEKYTQVAVNEFVFGGMENTSATTQTDATLHTEDIHSDFTSDDLVSHELAHQWFGDLVTCRTWHHGWLNEGWATFMETVFKEVDLGPEETDYFRFEELNIYLDEDKRLYRRPIVTNWYSDPAEIWDRHLYQKGGLVLNMLSAELGEEDFWAATKFYLEKFQNNVAETVDFQRCLETVSGRSLQSFFDQWLFKGGHPDLNVTFEWNEEKKQAKLTFKQKQNITDLTPVFQIRSQIEFFSPSGSSAFPIEITEKVQSFEFALNQKPEYCRFDKGNKLIKTLEWALPLEMLKGQLKKDTDVVGKIWAMKHLAKEATREGVEALIDRLKSDSFWAVRGEAALALGETKSQYAKEALLAALHQEKNSKARTRIAMALGEFKEEAVAEALINSFGTEENIFVRGAIVASLGKTKSGKAFEVLKAAIKIPSWHDWLATQAYVGLRHLRDTRALQLFMEGAQYGAPKFARMAAVQGLAEYGLDKNEVTELLNDLLDDPFARVRFVAADSLARRKDPQVIGNLETAATRNVDGHFKAAAFRAARRLRASLEKPEEINFIKDTLDKLSEENRRLKERVERLEK